MRKSRAGHTTGTELFAKIREPDTCTRRDFSPKCSLLVFVGRLRAGERVHKAVEVGQGGLTWQSSQGRGRAASSAKGTGSTALLPGSCHPASRPQGPRFPRPPPQLAAPHQPRAAADTGPALAEAGSVSGSAPSDGGFGEAAAPEPVGKDDARAPTSQAARDSSECAESCQQGPSSLYGSCSPVRAATPWAWPGRRGRQADTFLLCSQGPVPQNWARKIKRGLLSAPGWGKSSSWNQGLPGSREAGRRTDTEVPGATRDLGDWKPAGLAGRPLLPTRVLHAAGHATRVLCSVPVTCWFVTISNPLVCDLSCLDVRVNLFTLGRLTGGVVSDTCC